MTVAVTDENGVSHDVSFFRPILSYTTFNIWVNPLEGMDDPVLFAVAKGITAYLDGFDIGQSLVVPSLYGVCYASAGERANTFAITDLCATATAAGGTTRIRVPAVWNALLRTDLELIRFSTADGPSGTWFTFNSQGERVYVPA